MIELSIFFFGIAASIIGFWFVNFVFLPLRRFTEVKAKIERELLYYSHIITSPGAADHLSKEAHKIIRRLAVELEEKYLLVPFRAIFGAVHAIPLNGSVKVAKGYLFYISNNLSEDAGSTENMEALSIIYTSLDIKELEHRYNQKYQDAVMFRKAYLGERYKPLKLD